MSIVCIFPCISPFLYRMERTHFLCSLPESKNVYKSDQREIHATYFISHSSFPFNEQKGLVNVLSTATIGVLAKATMRWRRRAKKKGRERWDATERWRDFRVWQGGLEVSGCLIPRELLRQGQGWDPCWGTRKEGVST